MLEPCKPTSTQNQTWVRSTPTPAKDAWADRRKQRSVWRLERRHVAVSVMARACASTMPEVRMQDAKYLGSTAEFSKLCNLRYPCVCNGTGMLNLADTCACAVNLANRHYQEFVTRWRRNAPLAAVGAGRARCAPQAWTCGCGSPVLVHASCC